MKRTLFAALLALSLPTMAGAIPQIAADPAVAKAPLHLAGTCQQRVGPFVTQTTAWQRWRQARNVGFSISNGVTPCYDGYGSRGYCFYVFYGC